MFLRRRFIAFAVLLTCFLAFTFLNLSKVNARLYDLEISTTINSLQVKFIEIGYTNNVTILYKFDSNFDPVYDSNDNQEVITPGIANFDSFINNLFCSMGVNSLNIDSSLPFCMQIYSGDTSNYKMNTNLVFTDTSSPTIYKFVDDHELNLPFSSNSQPGDFNIMFVGQYSYTGYSYIIDQQNDLWNRNNISGSNISSPYTNDYESTKTGMGGRVRFKIVGTTKSGTKVRIEDKGDGKGPKVEKEVDNPNPPPEHQWEEVTDPIEKEDLLEEVANDLENDDFDIEELECYDTHGTPDDTNDDVPCDAIIFFKKSNGDRIGFKISRGCNGWTLDAKTKTKQELIDSGYLPANGTDNNPDGSWTVGGKRPGYDRFEFEKFYDGKPYFFGKYGVDPVYYSPNKPEKNHPGRHVYTSAPCW